MKKIIGIILSGLFCFGVLFGALPGSTQTAVAAAGDTYYYFPNGTSFIYELAVINVERSRNFTLSDPDLAVINLLKDNLIAGYTTVDEGNYRYLNKDLNDDAGGNYIYLGWRTTKDVDEAITGIRVSHTTDSTPPVTEYTDSQKVTWTLVNYGVSNHFIPTKAADFGTVDLNAGAGGMYIYMYYTKDPNFGPPLSYVGSSNTKTLPTSGSITYAEVFDFQNSWYDVNEGTGDEEIYLYTGTHGVVSKIAELRAYLPTVAQYLNQESKYFLPDSYVGEYNKAVGFSNTWGNKKYYVGNTPTAESIAQSLSTLQSLVAQVKGNAHF